MADSISAENCDAFNIDDILNGGVLGIDGPFFQDVLLNDQDLCALDDGGESIFGSEDGLGKSSPSWGSVEGYEEHSEPASPASEIIDVTETDFGGKFDINSNNSVGGMSCSSGGHGNVYKRKRNDDTEPALGSYKRQTQEVNSARVLRVTRMQPRAGRQATPYIYDDSEEKSMSKSAIAARENRQRKKQYIQNLESTVGKLKKDNQSLNSKVLQQQDIIGRPASDKAGVCLHVKGESVSLEFCSSCNFKASR